MATCPNDGASSRTDPNFTLEEVLVVQPITKSSLAGFQMKDTARSLARITHHTCGWSVVGRIEGDHLVVDAEATAAASRRAPDPPA